MAIEAFSAPRLVEYFDPSPCQMADNMALKAPAATGVVQEMEMRADRANSRGVTIEARYTVGEYDILILSARDSGGLESWLREHGYRIPDGAGPILASYLRQQGNS